MARRQKIVLWDEQAGFAYEMNTDGTGKRPLMNDTAEGVIMHSHKVGNQIDPSTPVFDPQIVQTQTERFRKKLETFPSFPMTFKEAAKVAFADKPSRVRQIFENQGFEVQDFGVFGPGLMRIRRHRNDDWYVIDGKETTAVDVMQLVADIGIATAFQSAGESGGAIGGAAVGSLIAPGPGTLVGGGIGFVGGGAVGSAAAEATEQQIGMRLGVRDGLDKGAIIEEAAIGAVAAVPDAAFRGFRHLVGLGGKAAKGAGEDFAAKMMNIRESAPMDRREVLRFRLETPEGVGVPMRSFTQAGDEFHAAIRIIDDRGLPVGREIMEMNRQVVGINGGVEPTINLKPYFDAMSSLTKRPTGKFGAAPAREKITRAVAETEVRGQRVTPKRVSDLEAQARREAVTKRAVFEEEFDFSPELRQAIAEGDRTLPEQAKRFLDDMRLVLGDLDYTAVPLSVATEMKRTVQARARKFGSFGGQDPSMSATEQFSKALLKLQGRISAEVVNGIGSVDPALGKAYARKMAEWSAQMDHLNGVKSASRFFEKSDFKRRNGASRFAKTVYTEGNEGTIQAIQALERATGMDLLGPVRNAFVASKVGSSAISVRRAGQTRLNEITGVLTGRPASRAREIRTVLGTPEPLSEFTAMGSLRGPAFLGALTGGVGGAALSGEDNRFAGGAIGGGAGFIAAAALFSPRNLLRIMRAGRRVTTTDLPVGAARRRGMDILSAATAREISKYWVDSLTDEEIDAIEQMESAARSTTAGQRNPALSLAPAAPGTVQETDSSRRRRPLRLDAQ